MNESFYAKDTKKKPQIGQFLYDMAEAGEEAVNGHLIVSDFVDNVQLLYVDWCACSVESKCVCGWVGQRPSLSFRIV